MDMTDCYVNALARKICYLENQIRKDHKMANNKFKDICNAKEKSRNKSNLIVIY